MTTDHEMRMELSWSVRCDCHPNEDPSGQRRMPMPPLPLFDDTEPFAMPASLVTSQQLGGLNDR